MICRGYCQQVTRKLNVERLWSGFGGVCKIAARSGSGGASSVSVCSGGDGLV